MNQYDPVIKAAMALLSPLLEVAIRDVKSGEITVAVPYYETSNDGRRLKCIDATVHDDDGKPISLISFRFDISVLSSLTGASDKPVELYGDNWQETIDGFFVEFLLKNGLLLKKKLTREEKKSLIEYLSKHGVFSFQYSTLYVAHRLGVSRTAVYSLKQMKGTDLG